jgi:hypothetical protein
LARVYFCAFHFVAINFANIGGGAKKSRRKKRQEACLFLVAGSLQNLRMANYLAIEASPEAIAAAEADAFLAFFAFLAGLADASPEAIAAAEAEAGAEAAAAGAEAEAEAAKAEVANMLATKTAINFFILFPRLVKKLVIHFESMSNNGVQQLRLTANAKKIKFFGKNPALFPIGLG